MSTTVYYEARFAAEGGPAFTANQPELGERWEEDYAALSLAVDAGNAEQPWMIVDPVTARVMMRASTSEEAVAYLQTYATAMESTEDFAEAFAYEFEGAGPVMNSPECDICEMTGEIEVPSVGTRVGSDGETYAVCQNHLDAPEASAYSLKVWSVGTAGQPPRVDREFPSAEDADRSLQEFAKGYEIHRHVNGHSGTLTTKCGSVNQASYTWNIRKVS